jgi:hypothetical protein
LILILKGLFVPSSMYIKTSLLKERDTVWNKIKCNKTATKTSKGYNFHFKSMFLHVTLKGPMSRFNILRGTFLLMHTKRFDRMLFPTL